MTHPLASDPEPIAPGDTQSPQVAMDLQTLAAAHRYRRWVYSQVQGALGRRIIEVGSGVGNYTEFLLAHGEVWATDTEEAYVRFLTRRFAGRPGLTVGRLTLGGWDEPTRRTVAGYRPDTFVCLNVLEHVERDDTALREMVVALAPGGRVAAVVPAMPSLYSPLDRRYGHFRRYAPARVRELVRDIPRTELERCRHFNLPGALGWWFNHVLLRRESLPRGQTRLFDRWVVPPAAALERVVPPCLGLSLAVWIRKTL